MTNKKLTIALIISVILNLFLVGVGTGMWYGKHQRGGLYQAFKHPPKDLNPEIRHQLKQKHELVRQNFKQVRKIKKQIRQTIMAPELDTERLRGLFAKMHEMRGEAAKASQEAMIEALGQMTYEERQAFAQDMDKRRPGFGKR